MSQAANNDAPFTSDYGGRELIFTIYKTDAYKRRGTVDMLTYLLVDGAINSMAGLAAFSSSLERGVGPTNGPPPFETCDANHSLRARHWRFGNESNLGWFSIIDTISTGVVTLYAVWWLYGRQRLKGVKVLNIIHAFQLGFATDETISKKTRFYFRGGVLVRAGYQPLNEEEFEMVSDK